MRLRWRCHRVLSSLCDECLVGRVIRRCELRSSHVGLESSLLAKLRCGNCHRTRVLQRRRVLEFPIALQWQQLVSSFPKKINITFKTSRQLAKHSVIDLRKKSSNNKLVNCGFFSKAFLMSFKKRDRMIQPPRHIKEIAPIFKFQLNSLLAAANNIKPWA